MENDNLPTSIIFDRDTIGQKAAQCWCLIRHTPLIFYDIFSNHVNNKPLSDICQLISLLIEILSFVFAPKISIDMTFELATLIEKHHKTFITLFPNFRLRPKHHMMIHYPRVIRIMGPLILLWCMGFEGKHLNFKKLSQCIQNFINCCKTFAFRHQEYAHYINVQDNDTLGVFCKDFPIGLSDAEFSIYASVIKKYKFDFPVRYVKSCFYIDEYKKGLFVCTGIDVHTKMPSFEEIQAIFVIKLVPYLILRKWNSTFIEQLNAFKLEKSNLDYTITKVTEIFYPATFEKLFVNNLYYIVPKHKMI